MSAEPEAAPAPETPPPPGDTEALKRLAAERDDFQARMLRALADYQNLVRRLDRERSDVELEKTRLAVSAFLGPLDDLGRLAAGLPASADASLRDAVQIVLKGFRKAMRDCGLEEVEALGLAFDPATHEAVGREARPDISAGQVVAVMVPGYRLRGRLLRPARVILSGVPDGEPGTSGRE